MWKIKSKEYYQKNKEKKKEYYQKNKEKIKEYYQKKKEKLTEEDKLRKKLYQKKYAEKNKQKLKEYKKKYNVDKKEHISLVRKEYAKRNKEKIRIRTKLYESTSEKYKIKKRRTSKNYWNRNKNKLSMKRTMNWHLHFINVCNRRNRVKYNNTVLDFDSDYLLELYHKQNGLCFYFNLPLKIVNAKKHPLKPSLDRIDNTKGYTKNNIVLCCLMANMGRNDCSYEEWIEFLAGLEIKKKC